MHYIDYNDRRMIYKYQNKLYRKLKDKQIDYINKRYIQKAVKIKMLVNGNYLDLEQKTAVLTDEVNTLVIAGAGSGKSLTIVGKINYLIENGICSKDILGISFTNDACNSLKDKLGYDVEVLTFHKLALKIIGYNQYKICSSNYLEYVVDEYFTSIIYNNPNMVDKVLKLSSISNKSYDEYLSTKEMKNLKQTVITFINLFKANNYSLEYFCKIDKKRFHDLLSIIVDIYILYKQELLSQGLIDFDDMISKATKKVQQYGISNNYKYIIIDEFQDTSLVKFELIQSIITKTGAKLFVVGDDFQSIYKFAGCSLDIFINFSKYVSCAKVVKITTTYRNSQQLVDVATKFILKNKYQIKKYITSNIRRSKPIKIVKYKNNILAKVIDYLINKGETRILILGRNNNDINKFLTPKMKKEGDAIYYDNRDISIKYLTIHRSKGLEEDIVIVINLTDDILGFPCKLKDAEILSLLNKQDHMLYEEERRLFYVCLTRTKKDIYLICPMNLSIFVKEIINDNRKAVEYLEL